jgi:hypothetical protein
VPETHHRGYLYTVPFGELGAVQNMSRDWVIDKLTVSVTYDTDLDKVKNIIKQIGKELQADPELAPHIIETLKMQGVEQFGEFAIEIRLKMMTKPGEQFVIRRRAYALIKKAFSDNGIEIALPTVTVTGGGEPSAAVAQRGTGAGAPTRARWPAPELNHVDADQNHLAAIAARPAQPLRNRSLKSTRRVGIVRRARRRRQLTSPPDHRRRRPVQHAPGNPAGGLHAEFTHRSPKISEAPSTLNRTCPVHQERCSHGRRPVGAFFTATAARSARYLLCCVSRIFVASDIIDLVSRSRIARSLS